MNRAPTPPSFSEALRFWLVLGFTSFGGPAGQIALMHAELVERRRWISERRFLHALNYCMVLPGPEAQQLATYIGWLLHRTAGGLVAGVLFVLPSFFLLVALAWIYLRFGDLPAVAGIFYGVKPAVTALVAHAAYRIGTRTLRDRWSWVVAITTFVVASVFEAWFPIIVLVAGVFGWLTSRWIPGAFATDGRHQAEAHGGHGAAVIDDDTPTPPHARFSRRRMAAVVASGLVVWTIAMGTLAAATGVDGTPATMGLFFTKAALVTFGGAYAVLPYVFQAAVEHFHWLTAAQMMDGLALGETTPGPLIIVVAFIGFVGGWDARVFGPDAVFAGALFAAGVATFFTFLPSFVMILAGGPVIEALQGRVRFTAPLAAIGAAVVGVILELALFFATRVFWPGGLRGPFDVVAAVIGLAAGIALFRFRVGVIPVILAAGVAGLVVGLLR